MNKTKYSRDENCKIAKFRTLEDPDHDDMKERLRQITKFNPQMKRSKTPSNYYTSLKLKNSSFKNWNTNNYYANIVNSCGEDALINNKSTNILNINDHKERCESKQVCSKLSISETYKNRSNSVFPFNTCDSSISKIQNMLEIKLMSKQKKKLLTLFKIKGKQLDCCVNKIEKQINSRRNSNMPFESSDIIGDISFLRNEKHFIIKVTNVREIIKEPKSYVIQHLKEYTDPAKNTIIMSIKQGMKLLIDNENSYSKVCDRLYYKFGKLLFS